MNAGRCIIYASCVLFVLCACTVHAASEACANAGTAGEEAALRQHVISLLQGGGQLERIPQSHALYPLQRIPLVATTTVLLTAGDSVLAARLYPELSKLVTDRFKDIGTVHDGIIVGDSPFTPDPEIALSPARNALVCLELFSLHRIAFVAGEYTDALEYLQSSQRLAGAITQAFFDPEHALLLPVDSQGRYHLRYEPEDLLPLLLDATLGDRYRRRIVETFLSRQAACPDSSVTGAGSGRLRGDPVTCCVLADLLSNLPGTASRQEAFGGMCGPAGEVTAQHQAHTLWIDFWKDRPSARKNLFPRWMVISSLVYLTRILEAQLLLDETQLQRITGDVETLRRQIGRDETNIDSHIEAVSTVNRLLALLSRLNSNITSKDQQSTVVNTARWERCSPRVRRLVTWACSASIEELMRAKAVLTGQFSKGTGLAAELCLPDSPVRFGKRIPCTASLRSAVDSFTISQLYIQIGDHRWKITDNDRCIHLAAGSPPVVFDKDYPLPPGQRSKIVPIQAIFDFLLDERRIEMHTIESATLTAGYLVTLNFPEGNRLGGGPLPVDIVIKYQPDHDVQGIIEGHILKELSFDPELPARFLLRSSDAVTTLPLTIVQKPAASPGRYPFFLSVILDGAIIEQFEDTVIRPLRWFHLGPLARSPHLLKNAVHYQDNLTQPYRNADAEEIRWREVPQGAVDREGAVIPERLFGIKSNQCLLLYTVIDSPGKMKLLWKLRTANMTSLWVNGDPVLSGDDIGETSLSGPFWLRRGLNSILLASCWQQRPDRILFEIVDENGLPVSGITNDVDRIIDEIRRNTAEQLPGKTAPRPSESFREMTITLQHPEASEVCVIGTFNNWELGATPMSKSRDGLWRATVVLPPGRYPYKFVIDQQARITDPVSRQVEPDGFGGMNSVLVVE